MASCLLWCTESELAIYKSKLIWLAYQIFLFLYSFDLWFHTHTPRLGTGHTELQPLTASACLRYSGKLPNFNKLFNKILWLGFNFTLRKLPIDCYSSLFPLFPDSCCFYFFNFHPLEFAFCAHHTIGMSTKTQITFHLAHLVFSFHFILPLWEYLTLLTAHFSKLFFGLFTWFSANFSNFPLKLFMPTCISGISP